MLAVQNQKKPYFIAVIWLIKCLKIHWSTEEGEMDPEKIKKENKQGREDIFNWQKQ